MPFDYLTLKAFRQELRLTQAELAEKLQVPQSTVARWEGGYVAPNANHIGAMCDLGRVAGVEPGFFFPPYSHYPQRKEIS
ncbi:MAG: XRE family transcriptional regulator [Candidatus Latescibacteria bacterium]|nr:XRE family transcriptional regulator [Candidatus Latescibacterota bacterium]